VHLECPGTLAVAAGLSAAGQEVRLVTSVDDTDYRGLCQALRIPLQMVPERVGADLARVFISLANPVPAATPVGELAV
jgi:hypothetical protein